VDKQTDWSVLLRVKRSAKAQATRRRILEAANRLFYLYGYHATGLDRIIREAGVTKGNFYHHFPGKEALAVAVLEWHRDEALREVDVEDILRDPSPLGGLLRFLEAMARRTVCPDEACEVRGCFFGNFALELSAGSPAVRGKLREIFDDIRAVLLRLIRAGQTAGEIRADLDPDRAAGLILSLMEGAILLDKAQQRQSETLQAIGFVRGYLTP